MGTSIQRIFAMTLALRALLLVIAVMYAGVNYDYTDVSTSFTEVQNITDTIRTDYGDVTPDSETIVLQREFGDTKLGGRATWSAIKEGLIYLDDKWAVEEWEKTTILMINIFMWIINFLIVVELLLIIINKKTT